MTMKLAFEPDDDFPYEGFNEPFLFVVDDDKPHLSMVAFDMELGHDVEVLCLEITKDMTEEKAKKLAELLKKAGNFQAFTNGQGPI